MPIRPTSVGTDTIDVLLETGKSVCVRAPVCSATVQNIVGAAHSTRFPVRQ
jgi:hypothetical protein